MPIGLTAKLVTTATKIAVTRNEYGAYQYGAQSSTKCLYRDASHLTQSGAREEDMIDGLLWFDSTENVKLGDVYQIAGVNYQVKNIIKAQRRVVDNALSFIKCEVKRTRQVS